MQTDLWVARPVDVRWNEFRRQARPAVPPFQSWEQLREQVDVAYLCFAKLRRSDADQDELAADAAWACWRARRLMRVSARSTAASFPLRLRLRATWLALNVRWGARPRHDIATAQLVVATLRRLLAGLEVYTTRLTNSGQLEAMLRRRAELAEVLDRAALVTVHLENAGAPLWESFIPRRGCP